MQDSGKIWMPCEAELSPSCQSLRDFDSDVASEIARDAINHDMACICESRHTPSKCFVCMCVNKLDLNHLNPGFSGHIKVSEQMGPRQKMRFSAQARIQRGTLLSLLQISLMNPYFLFLIIFIARFVKSQRCLLLLVKLRLWKTLYQIKKQRSIFFSPSCFQQLLTVDIYREYKERL